MAASDDEFAFMRAAPQGAAADARTQYRLGYQLRLADRALQLAAEERMRPLGLNVAQLMTLLFIDRFPEITMARLATLATVSAQTMHRSATTLIERGLLARIDKPGDRKSFGLALTATGKALLRKGEAGFRAVQDIANARLTERERATLFRLLRRYEEALRGK